MIIMKMRDTDIQPFLAFLSCLAETEWKGKKGLLAKEAGISGGYLSEILKRKKIPSEEVAIKISAACGYKYEEFLKKGFDTLLKEESSSIGDFPEEPKTSGLKKDFDKYFIEYAIKTLLETHSIPPSIGNDSRFSKMQRELDKIVNDHQERQKHKKQATNELDQQRAKKNAKHHEIIDRFQDYELATEINLGLVELEKYSKEGLEDIKDFIQSKIKRHKKKRAGPGQETGNANPKDTGTG